MAASKPGLLILAGRSLAKTTATQAALEEAHPGVPTRILELDLSSLASVRKAAATVNGWSEKIDVLLNNAGIMAQPYFKTADGFEAQFGTNHMGHFVFTNLILPKVTRVVNVSSDGHHFSSIRYDDPMFNTPDSYERWQAYGQAKTANILFSVGLANRGVEAYSLHPGVIFTNLASHFSDDEKNVLVESLAKAGTTAKSDNQGAATHLVASFVKGAKWGSYFADCQPVEPLPESAGNASTPLEAKKELEGGVEATGPRIPTLSRYAADKENADRLWKLSEELLGEKFEVSRK
jgi:NAD(P)-dependent dehydrogenase (short-subunit alcohol dehydrogenase family)